MPDSGITCRFCNALPIVQIFARHGHEEVSCEEHLLLALRTCAEREYQGETLHMKFLDKTGHPHD